MLKHRHSGHALAGVRGGRNYVAHYHIVVLRLFRYQHRTTWFYKLFYGCSRVILAQSEELDRYRTTCPQNNVFGEVVPGLFHRYAQIAVWNNVVPVCV